MSPGETLWVQPLCPAHHVQSLCESNTLVAVNLTWSKQWDSSIHQIPPVPHLFIHPACIPLTKLKLPDTNIPYQTEVHRHLQLSSPKAQRPMNQERTTAARRHDSVTVKLDGVNGHVYNTASVTPSLLLGLLMTEAFASCVLQVKVGLLPPWSTGSTLYNTTTKIRQ